MSKDLEALCKCGHQQGDHTGVGLCINCDCTHFVEKPKPKPTAKPKQPEIPDRIIKGQEVLKRIIDEGHDAVMEGYGEGGLLGYNSALGVMMQPMANIGDIPQFMASDRFNIIMQSVEAQLGFILGVRVGMSLRKLMIILEQGGSIEGCEVKFSAIKK